MTVEESLAPAPKEERAAETAAQGKQPHASVEGKVSLPGATPAGGGDARGDAEVGRNEGTSHPELEAPDMSVPLALDHLLLEDGKKAPLPGVESLFCTSSTLQLLGLNDLVESVDGRPPVPMKTITKEELLKDIQFRGSISDFHYLKAAIQAAQYDPLIVRYNQDDLYGDGNNIELVLQKEAADVWLQIKAETERRHKWAEMEAAREAAEKALPKSKRTWRLKPWISLGSEAEVEETAVVPTREPIVMTAQRKRREFNQVRRGGESSTKSFRSQPGSCPAHG